MEDEKKESLQSDNTPEESEKGEGEEKTPLQSLPPLEESPKSKDEEEEKKKEELVPPPKVVKPVVAAPPKEKVKRAAPPPQQEEPSGWGFGWFSNASKKVLSTVANTLQVVEDSEEEEEEEEEEKKKEDISNKSTEALPVIGTEFFNGLFSSAKDFLDTVEKTGSEFIVKGSEILDNVREQSTKLIEQTGVMEKMTGIIDQLFTENDDDFQNVNIKPIDLSKENRIEELVGQMKGFDKMGILVRLRDECEKVIDLMKKGEETFYNKQKILEERKKSDGGEDIQEKDIIKNYFEELEKQIKEFFNIPLFLEKMKKEEYVHLMKTEIGRNVKKLSRNGVNTTEHSVKNFNMYATNEAKTMEDLKRQGMGLIVKLRKIENWFSSIILCLGVANVLHFSHQMCNEKSQLYIPTSFLIKGSELHVDGKVASSKEICHIVLIFLKLLMHETQSLRTKFTDSIQKIYSIVQVKTGDEGKKAHALAMETSQVLIESESFSLKEVEKLIPLFQTVLLYAILKFGEPEG